MIQKKRERRPGAQEVKPNGAHHFAHKIRAVSSVGWRGPGTVRPAVATKSAAGDPHSRRRMPHSASNKYVRVRVHAHPYTLFAWLITHCWKYCSLICCKRKTLFAHWQDHGSLQETPCYRVYLSMYDTRGYWAVDPAWACMRRSV
jgi:hypothetical protein